MQGFEPISVRVSDGWAVASLNGLGASARSSRPYTLHPHSWRLNSPLYTLTLIPAPCLLDLELYTLSPKRQSRRPGSLHHRP